MILRKITIQNIRSYDNYTSIDLPKGTILFQGDIGCGKSSILLSIEFALFGLGDLDGRHLLRNGKSKGSVELEFEVNDKLYVIFRSLVKKAKNVVQGEGYLIEDGLKTDYSVGELKARVLEIINIKERVHPKTTSVIYRFAIFTPQEMMKQVLTESQDRRLEILRRAFGIEEYNIIKKNIIETGIPWLRGEARTSKELSKDLLEKQNALENKKKIAKQISDELENDLHLLADYEIQRKKIERQLHKLEKKKETVVRLEESIPLLKNKISAEKTRISESSTKLEQLEDGLDNIRAIERNLVLLKPKYDDYLEKKNTISGLEKSVELLSKLEKDKIKFEKDIEKDKQHFEDKIKRLQEEIIDNDREIKDKTDSIKDLEKLSIEKESLDLEVKLLPQFRNQFVDLSNNISKYDSKKESLLLELEKKTKEIDQINEIGEGVPCPKCRQKLTKEHISTVISDFKNEKRKINQEIKEIEEKLELLILEHKKIERKITVMEEADRKIKYISLIIVELEERKKSITSLSMKVQEKKEDLKEQTTILEENRYCQNERNELVKIEQKIRELSKDVENYKILKQIVERYEEQNIGETYLESMQEVKQKSKIEKEVNEISEKIKEIELVISSDKKELKIKELLLDREKQVISKIIDIESEKREIEKKYIECKTTIASKQSKLDSINISDFESEVSKKEGYFRDMIVYSQANTWTNECFIPIVIDIEQNVLSSINEEFNIMFQHWFNLLVDTGEITVEVDETFTPLVTQGGYTLDVMSLSGGEKTSVALAYRLALNTMIKKTSSFKSHLLILDEPTDGFSSEQLIRLRYVLDEMDSSQIIMVSHERELESFVSTIYRITKNNGISTVQMMT